MVHRWPRPAGAWPRPAWTIGRQDQGTQDQQPGLVRAGPPQEHVDVEAGTWTRQVRHRFACLVCIKFASSLENMCFVLIQTSSLVWIFVQILCLVWTVWTMFAFGLHQNDKISWGNLIVLKHANQQQTLTKPSKPSLNYKQTNTVCWEMVNKLFKILNVWLLQWLVNLILNSFPVPKCRHSRMGTVLPASRRHDGSRSRKTKGSLADTLQCNIWRRSQTPGRMIHSLQGGGTVVGDSLHLERLLDPVSQVQTTQTTSRNIHS